MPFVADVTMSLEAVSSSVASDSTSAASTMTTAPMPTTMTAPMPTATTYRCSVPYCDRVFSDSYSLAEHLRLHAGEKRHICPVRSCGRRFSTPGNLSRHKRLHGPIKPLECPVESCICTFRSENKLAKHMKFHLGSAVHVCPAPACGKTFSTAGNLNRHIKGHHPKVDVRAAKALLASKSAAMRLTPPAGHKLSQEPSVLDSNSIPVVNTPTQHADVDVAMSPAVVPAVCSAPVTIADPFAGMAAPKKPLGEELDPVQLDMLVSLLDVETPAIDYDATMMTVDQVVDPRLGMAAWGNVVYPPAVVAPTTHGEFEDLLRFPIDQL